MHMSSLWSGLKYGHCSPAHAYVFCKGVNKDCCSRQVYFVQATHKDFANKLYGTGEVAKSSRFSKPKLDQTGFTIEHYAGAVSYRTENFLNKNKDFVVAEHQQLMQNSSVEFVRALFPPEAEETTPQKVRNRLEYLKRPFSAIMLANCIPLHSL